MPTKKKSSLARGLSLHGGKYRIQKSYKGIGFIRAITNTDNIDTANSYLAMLNDIYAQPHYHHYLEDLRDTNTTKLTVAKVFAEWRGGLKLDRAETAHEVEKRI